MTFWDWVSQNQDVALLALVVVCVAIVMVVDILRGN